MVLNFSYQICEETHNIHRKLKTMISIFLLIQYKEFENENPIMLPSLQRVIVKYRNYCLKRISLPSNNQMLLLLNQAIYYQDNKLETNFFLEQYFYYFFSYSIHQVKKSFVLFKSLWASLFQTHHVVCVWDFDTPEIDRDARRINKVRGRLFNAIKFADKLIFRVTPPPINKGKKLRETNKKTNQSNGVDRGHGGGCKEKGLIIYKKCLPPVLIDKIRIILSYINIITIIKYWCGKKKEKLHLTIRRCGEKKDNRDKLGEKYREKRENKQNDTQNLTTYIFSYNIFPTHTTHPPFPYTYIFPFANNNGGYIYTSLQDERGYKTKQCSFFSKKTTTQLIKSFTTFYSYRNILSLLFTVPCKRTKKKGQTQLGLWGFG